jgi:male-specific lethal 2
MGHMLKMLVHFPNKYFCCTFQVNLGNFKKPPQRTSSSKASTGGGSGNKGSGVTAGTKRKGCRCGNATATPGKLTCCGQRCPCYVESKACMECRCRGCRNPHRPGGHKVQFLCYVIVFPKYGHELSLSTQTCRL